MFTCTQLLICSRVHLYIGPSWLRAYLLTYVHMYICHHMFQTLFPSSERKAGVHKCCTFVCLCMHTHLFICSCVYEGMYAHTHTLATHVHYYHLLKGRQGYTSVNVSVSYSYTYTCNTCSLFPSSERKAGVYKCIHSCVHMLTHAHLFIYSCVRVGMYRAHTHLFI